jgi:hypothetical protein
MAISPWRVTGQLPIGAMDNRETGRPNALIVLRPLA